MTKWRDDALSVYYKVIGFICRVYKWNWHGACINVYGRARRKM